MLLRRSLPASTIASAASSSSSRASQTAARRTLSSSSSSSSRSSSSSSCCTRTLLTSTTHTTSRIPSLQASRTMSTFSTFKLPALENEPNQHYGKGTPERQKLEAALKVLESKGTIDIPLVINGKEITSDAKLPQYMPHSHATTLASSSSASAAQVQDAITGALEAKKLWATLPYADRAAVFLKAADLISTKYRYELMAATMLGQGKNAWQAEIDAAAELVDFLRFNCAYAQDLYAQQPIKNSPGVWNRVEYRPLEGFVYAITPFNFTAIAGNLPCAPALLGNVVVWKPSPAAIYSNYILYQILLEAGLPPGVIQFVPGDAESVTASVLSHKEFASLHYTGSTSVFRHLYGAIAQGVTKGTYKSYPRIVGETGGKNFHVVHSSADVTNAVMHTIRGAFEYQGQKCSATSRLYVSESIWPAFKSQLISETSSLKIGPCTDFSNFAGPVIHRGSFDKLKSAIDSAKSSSELEILVGGKTDGSKGFYIHPTIIQTTDPTHALLNTELFGPVLTVYVYPDAQFPDILRTVDATGGGYALTGSIFAKDREVIRYAEDALRESAGNFYINCKSTGAVVGQQPFGGGRASGTNDKAGSMNLLSRFVSARAIKEEFLPTVGTGYASNEV